MSLSRDQREYAARLLRKAREDLVVVELLLDKEEAPDPAIGFHAQQAVEKAMKSVLVVHGVEFRRAHDLDYLLEVAEEGGVEVPEYVAATEWLTPWAAEFRYDEPEIAGFDRAESLRSTLRVIEWAQGVLDAAP
ncbi:MAG TPA: HEPN domain-containing protein [Conexibacter sp.]|nr:HEPN domain-containing protein [Conexibacter sp.]